MTSLLAGRSITVIGAGTQPSRDPDAPVGNGRAIAVRAAREGASVVCVDRDEAAVEETWRLITEEGGKAAVVVADVTTEEGCRLAVSDEPGRAPDGLVLNVGTGFGMGMAGTSIDDWDKTFDLNLRAHFMLVRRALVTLSDNAAILFVGSVAGLRPGSRIPAYDASKAGLIGLSRHVAVEGARRGIRANVLAPGLIDTPLGRYAADFLICGTGIDVEFSRRPELRRVADNIARWSDRYDPPEAERDERLGRYPYLGPDFALLPRRAGLSDWMSDIHLFNIAATMSFGPSGSSINAMTTSVPKLVNGLTRGLFEGDLERHWQSLQRYDVPQAVLRGNDP